MNENELINHAIKTYSDETAKFASVSIDSITYKEFCIQELYELNLVYFGKSIQTYKAYFDINYEHNIFTRYYIKNTELISWWSLCRFKRLFNWIWFHDSKTIILQLLSEAELFDSRLLMTLFEDEQYIKFIDMNAKDSYAQLAEYNLYINNYEYIMNQLKYYRNQRLVLNKVKCIYEESE